jgi:hypothetical protein
VNPFHIGDVVVANNPFMLSLEEGEEHTIKDISEETIRFKSASWYHFSHFTLVRQGLISRIGDTGAIPESHPVVGVKISEESDPKGLPSAAPGAKNDLGKVEAGLLLDFSMALEGVAQVCTFGAKKYSRHGWLHVDEGERRYRDASIRHLLAQNLEENDPESGLLHLAHEAWNLLALLELRLRSKKQ